MDRSPAPAELLAGPQLGDAFGALLLQCWEHGGAAGQVLEFVERDDGYLAAADAARYFAAPEAWDRLHTWASTQVQGRVLDIGSGAGRHALPLQHIGHDVVALDVSPGATEVCRRRGVRQTVTGTLADLRAQGTPSFNTLLLLGNNLGLLETAQQARTVLRTLADLASPDAVLIGEGRDPYATTQPLHLAYHQHNRARGRLPGQIRMRVRHQHLATPWFDYLFLSVEELQGLVAGSAWRMEQCEREGASYIVLLRRAPS